MSPEQVVLPESKELFKEGWERARTQSQLEGASWGQNQGQLEHQNSDSNSKTGNHEHTQI